jgi:hypothetical protein
MDKEKWVQFHLEHFKDCREDVIRFISNIIYHTTNPDCNRGVRSLFANGYCYYFAYILKDAFGGEVCWHKGFGHIVWRDANKCCYDIDGVFDNYTEDNEIVPMYLLGESLEDFRHRGVKIRENYDITNTPYLNLILIDPLWNDLDCTISDIRRAFEQLPDDRKANITAEQLMHHMRKRYFWWQIDTERSDHCPIVVCYTEAEVAHKVKCYEQGLKFVKI